MCKEVCCDGAAAATNGYHAGAATQKSSPPDPGLRYLLRRARHWNRLLGKEALQFLLDDCHTCRSLVHLHLQHLLEQRIKLSRDGRFAQLDRLEVKEGE